MDCEKQRRTSVEHAKKVAPLNEIFDLSGKTAVVTGSAGGLGYLIANRLLEAGANVVISDIDDERGADAIETLTGDLGRKNVVYKHADIRIKEEINVLMDFAKETFGSLDICVANAAAWSYYYIEELELEEWNRVIDTDLTGAFLTVQAAGRVMKEQGKGGKIVTVASVAGINCEPFDLMLNYAAAKAGLIGFSKSCARTFKKYGINLNVVLPGAMATYAGATKGTTPEKFDYLINNPMPAPQSVTPDDVGRVVFTMCTPISDFMYGATIVADGGAHLFTK